MIKFCKYFTIAVLLSAGLLNTAVAAMSGIKGDPQTPWAVIGNNKKIENNEYQRCKVIRAMLPGVGKIGESRRNIYDTMSQYIANLYVQSIMIPAYIAAEEEGDKGNDKTNQVEVIKQEQNKHLGNIARRLNIINSLEAGTAMIELLTELSSLPSTTYQSFKTHKNGGYGTECEELK